MWSGLASATVQLTVAAVLQEFCPGLVMATARAGAGFAFDPLKPTHLPNTLKAHQLIRLAHFDGAQERLALALRGIVPVARHAVVDPGGLEIAGAFAFDRCASFGRTEIPVTGDVVVLRHHRSQIVAQAGGVSYVNDSKATNVDSAVQGLRAFSNIRWICGGLQKEGGLEALNAASENVAKAYVIGREAAQFALQLTCETEICTDMATAVARAHAEAQQGDDKHMRRHRGGNTPARISSLSIGILLHRAITTWRKGMIEINLPPTRKTR